MASTPPPTNSKAVWFNPRDDSGDKILYYLRDGRSSKHAGLAPLTPHPLAASNPIYEGLVFLNRTPADDEEAGLVKDWYGPSSLVDDLLSVREVGGGYESTLLYARGTTPPDEDARVDVLGRQTLRDVGPVSMAWVDDPLTSSPGIDLVLLTDVSTLEGDEVYIVTSGGDMKALEPIFGLNVKSKRLKIARHISSTSVHVEIPYNSSVDLSELYVGADVYEAHYLLDGYTDTETAPGVLSGLFHTRTFSYRLAEPSYSSEWTNTLGLQVITENRLLPHNALSPHTDGSPASLATAEKSINYELVSDDLVMRSTQIIVRGEDDELSVKEVGGGYESFVLYERGTAPPDEDHRIDVLGRQTHSVTDSQTALAWVDDPLTSAAGINLALFTISTGTFEGDEVYIIISGTSAMTALEPIFGSVSTQRLKIARHISTTSVHVEIPYNGAVNLATVEPAATIHEALYLLDGYRDDDSAPGAFAGLFHTRTFVYRLAEPSYSPTWDETLGLQFITEQRAFPSSWARTLAGASLSSATVNSSITYEIESKLIAIRSKRTISGDPDQDELEWSSRTRITVPAICYGIDVPYCWSYVAVKDDEDEWRQDYALALAITKSTLNSHEVGVATRTVRRILPESGVKAFVDALGHPFSFTTSTAQISVRQTWGFAGANIGAGAMIRTATIGPCLLGGAHSGRMLVKVPEDEGAKNIKKSPEGIYPTPSSEAIAEAADRAADSATATVTITNYAELNSGDKVNLIATDGTNYDFTNGSQSSVAGTWESATSNDQTATNLMNVINTGSGPSGTRFSASVDGAVVTITQATSGSAGNTEVTLTDTGTAGMSKTDFIGGGPGSGAASGSENVLSPGMSKWYTGQRVPWQSEVLWDVKTEKGRWGYWVVDITYLTLPPDPVRNLFPTRFIKTLDNLT